MSATRYRALLSFAALCLPALASAPVMAQDAPAPPAEIAELVGMCNTCHGDAGIPAVEEAPVIWGQENYYMYLQMRDIKSGLRASEIMQPLVADLDKATLKKLAEYYSTLKWPALGYFTPDADVAVAEQAAVVGQCTQCHLGAWTGNSRVPRLAGQTVAYLNRTMLDFRDKKRKNAPDMSSFLGDMTDAQIMALATYGAGK